jgi:opacity protein-like surface antigen
MKKTMLLTAGCTLTVLCALPALAAEKATGPYMSGHLGVTMPSDTTLTDSTVPGVSLEVEYDSGLALNLALGYKFGPTRLEGEIGYQKNDFDDVTVSIAGVGSASLKNAGVPFSGDVKTTSFLMNGYYDFTNDSAFTSYLTAGLGLAKVKASFDLPSVGYSGSDSDTVFAYQLGAGVEYALNQTVSLDVRYRYFATSDPSFDTLDAEFGSHNLMLGAKIKF